jgi:hypothetical protein
MMRLRTVIWLATLLAAFAAPPASAQVTTGTPVNVYVPTGSYTTDWNAATPASAAPEDAVAGYTVVAATVVQTGAGTGVTVKTWDVGNVLTLTLPGAELPAAPFFLSVRARSVAGLVSQHSNSLPFQPAGTPSAPTTFRRRVAGQ